MCPGINSFQFHPSHDAAIADHASWNQQLIGFEVEGGVLTPRVGA